MPHDGSDSNGVCCGCRERSDSSSPERSAVGYGRYESHAYSYTSVAWGSRGEGGVASREEGRINHYASTYDHNHPSTRFSRSGRSLHRMSSRYGRPHDGSAHRRNKPLRREYSGLSRTDGTEGNTGRSWAPATSLIRVHSIPSLEASEMPRTPSPAPLVRTEKSLVRYRSEDYGEILLTATESAVFAGYNQSMRDESLAASDSPSDEEEPHAEDAFSTDLTNPFRFTRHWGGHKGMLIMNNAPLVSALQSHLPAGQTVSFRALNGSTALYVVLRNGEVFISPAPRLLRPHTRTRFLPPPSSLPPAPTAVRGCCVPFVPTHPVPSPQPLPMQPVVRRPRMLRSRETDMSHLNCASYGRIRWVDSPQRQRRKF